MLCVYCVLPCMQCTWVLCVCMCVCVRTRVCAYLRMFLLWEIVETFDLVTKRSARLKSLQSLLVLLALDWLPLDNISL